MELGVTLCRSIIINRPEKREPDELGLTPPPGLRRTAINYIALYRLGFLEIFYLYTTELGS